MSIGFFAMAPVERLTRAEAQQRTRTRLLEAAYRLIRENGVDAISLEAIAAEAGVTRGAIYGNFTNKRELFLAMIRETPDLDSRAFAPLEDVSLPWAERLSNFAAANVERLAADTRDVALQTDLLSYILRDVQLREETAQTYRRLVGALADALATESVRRDHGLSALEIVAIFHAVVDGLSIHRAIDPELFNDNTVVRAFEALATLIERPPNKPRRRRSSPEAG